MPSILDTFIKLLSSDFKVQVDLVVGIMTNDDSYDEDNDSTIVYSEDDDSYNKELDNHTMVKPNNNSVVVGTDNIKIKME